METEKISATDPYLEPRQLEKYSFWWTEARLFLGAMSLFLGVPVVVKMTGGSLFVTNLVNMCWILSGVVAVYMAYRWVQNQQLLFGEKRTLDRYAFWFTVVTGVNLGLTGLTSNNPGMSILENRIAWAVMGVLYLAVAYYFYKRWYESGQSMFGPPAQNTIA